MALYNTHPSGHDGEVAGTFRKFWAVGTQKWLGDGEVGHDQKGTKVTEDHLLFLRQLVLHNLTQTQGAVPGID